MIIKYKLGIWTWDSFLTLRGTWGWGFYLDHLLPISINTLLSYLQFNVIALKLIFKIIASQCNALIVLSSVCRKLRTSSPSCPMEDGEYRVWASKDRH